MSDVFLTTTAARERIKNPFQFLLLIFQSINRILFQTANVHRNIIGLMIIIIIIVIMVKLDIREEKKKRETVKHNAQDTQ